MVSLSLWLVVNSSVADLEDAVRGGGRPVHDARHLADDLDGCRVNIVVYSRSDTNVPADRGAPKAPASPRLAVLLVQGLRDRV